MRELCEGIRGEFKWNARNGGGEERRKVANLTLPQLSLRMHGNFFVSFIFISRGVFCFACNKQQQQEYFQFNYMINYKTLPSSKKRRRIYSFSRFREQALWCTGNLARLLLKLKKFIIIGGGGVSLAN
jgi:hypothetical protein